MPRSNREHGPERLRILIVEDNDDHFAITSRLLRAEAAESRFHAHTLRAGTIAEAVATLQTETIDVVLLDLGLPDSEFGQTLPSVLSHADEAAVIVLTALDDFAIGMESIAAGAQDFVTKVDLDRDLLHRSILYAVERKENQLALARANAELKRFAHTVAHEVRTPAAAAIMGIDSFRQMRDQSPEIAEQMLDTASSSLRGMLQLVVDMLHFAEAEEANSAAVPLDLADLCGEVVAGFASLLAEADGQVDVGPLPTVVGNRTQIMRLMQNLIGNAIKYRGEQPLRIAIELADPFDGRDPDGHVFVSVRDNGVGITDEDQTRIFTMFYRAETRDEVAGTGVGLALCRNIMQRMGGAISVDSTPGVGSRFLLAFPTTLEETAILDARNSRTASSAT